MNKFAGIVLIVALIGAAAFLYTYRSGNAIGGNGVESGVTDYKNASYVIDGVLVTLKDGVSSVPAAPGSAAKIETQYFGNDLVTDLNNDGREDRVFWVTQSTGGSGTFFYVVAALNTERGIVGSDGYLAGDRIAPQRIDLSQNPRHKNVIAANFAERKAGEPMTASPSVGKSIYLKIDPSANRWAVVVADFEGESR